MTRALYPGTFDPITNGHLDIIQRASRLFDVLVVAVADGTHKETAFELSKRKRLVEESVDGMENIEVVTMSGLLADKCRELSVSVVIRGLRAVSDFEYELELALMNRHLNENVDTIFMMTNEHFSFIRSSLVKEVARLGGDISVKVPQVVEKYLKKRFHR